MNLPKDFIDKMKTLLDEEIDDFLKSLDSPTQKAITCNFARMDRETFESLADFQYTQIPKIKNGYLVDSFKFSNHILNHLGIIYSQEPSAMYPAELLDVQKGDIVLDLCSAPGGKSIQILEKLNGSGILVCNEIVYNRTKILYENLTRMGFSNFAITCNSPKDYEDTVLKFDKILVDAPCGGEGMFRRDNFDFKSYNNASIETNAKRQLSILESIKKLLKKGGRLVYSTCTYDVRENEGVIAEFLNTNPNFEIIEIDGYENVTSPGIHIAPHHTEYSMRRYPHKFAGEGQFMAVLHKKGEETIDESNFYAEGFSRIYRKDIDTLNRELKNTLDISKLDIVRRHDNYYILPDTELNLKNLNVVSIGTLLGTINKDSFKLSHNFYHIMGDRLYNTYNLNDSEVIPYLQGLELDTQSDIKGMCTVTYKNIPLGGGKMTDGKLKNHYPKELRIK